MEGSSTIGINIDLIIVRDGQILLGRWKPEMSEGKEMWGVPGKDLRFGETFSQCAERNLRQEFDVGMTNCEVIGVNANHAFDRHYIDIAMTAVPEGEIDLTVRTPEWAEWRWFKLEELPPLFDAATTALASWKQQKVCVSE